MDNKAIKAEPGGSRHDAGDVRIKAEPSETSMSAESSPAIGVKQEVKIKPEPDASAGLGLGLGLEDEDADDLADAEIKASDYLVRLMENKTPEVLEAGVSVGVDLLDQLKDVLETHRSEDVDTWLKTVDELRERAKPTRTVVGVVGNTGAGKSSVINALLDEERLLPTNCLRACTASPTEISYNYTEDPDALYRAEIEFISAQDWLRELELLFNDLLDGNGEVSRDCTNSDSDAGVAYAKLKAVYPQKTREMLAGSNPKDMAKEPAVRAVLGSVKKLQERSAKEIYRRMQHYVDSKEKSTGPVDHKKRNIPMEYWPLIKVVRIYTKADALSTGAVIVDLPGVQDSNAARAAVASNYMKSCTGLWIVAPITRAVDDKTAKSLLGDTFKRQLKYDGTYSAVSFICSKTDDISITEAAESLGLEEEISESWNKARELRNLAKSLESKIDDLKEARAAYGEQLDDCETRYDLWEDLQSKFESGTTVYEPSAKSKKRKRAGRPSGSRKNLTSSDVEDDNWDGAESDSSDKENSQSNANRTPLTEADIEAKLSLIKAERKKIRGERRDIDTQVVTVRKEIQDAVAEKEAILAELKHLCIQGRNEYSRGAIKQDFAMGIKELDQENAIEEDENAFNPDQDIRDYEEVARSLPVFCVSSRAYQKLSERLEKDDFESHGFLSVEDTEIPKLQEHAKKLTEAGRANHCRGLLNDLNQLVNSLLLWSSSSGTQSHLTDVEKRREELHLTRLLATLEKGLETSIRSSMESLQQTLEENILQAFDSSIPLAVNAAVPTAEGWGAHRSMGGMYWATYKATVRREGVYSGASGPRDFNQELFEPVSRNLANGWERAFQRGLPQLLNNFANEAKGKLRDFHEAAKARAMERHTNVTGIMTLGNMILGHIRTLQGLPDMVRGCVTELQREASREFTPVICDVMRYAYQVCTEERGPGSYARMKTAMISHVDSNRGTMFRHATDAVAARLDAMCRTVKKQITESTENIFDAVFRDYMHVLVGTTLDRRAKISKEEGEMRKKAYRLLRRVDAMFAPVLGEVPENRDLEHMDNADEDVAGQNNDDAKEEREETDKSEDMPMDNAADDVDPPKPKEKQEVGQVQGQGQDQEVDTAEVDDLAADEMMQQQILEQTQLAQSDGAGDGDDVDGASEDDDEFPDIMDFLQ